MNDVCSLRSGVGELKGMVEAAMVVLFQVDGWGSYYHRVHRHRFGGFIHDCSGLWTPTQKSLRQTLPRGKIQGLSKRFNRGTNTEHGILHKGWALVMWSAAIMALRRRCRPSLFYPLEIKFSGEWVTDKSGVNHELKSALTKKILLDPL